MYNRAILHLDLDAFFVAVECLENSALSGKPVIVGGTSGRGVVASCSYEARRFGVHSAMPMRMALRLCPDAIVVRGDMERYSRYSTLVTEVIEEEAPLYEKASIDEFYLDLTGMDRYFGCWKWSQALREKVIRETGLPLSVGLSVNKLVSKVGAGEAKPNGARMIEAGIEKAFLAPLSTRKLPSVGEQTYKKLSFMGVRQVGVLAQLPPSLLEREFGKHGRDIWNKANAIDDRPVEPYRERKSISSEQTFHEDTIDVRFLKDRLQDMTVRLGFTLRTQQKLTSCVTVKVRYADFNTYTRQKNIAYTANDRVLIRYVRELFDQLYQRRQRVRLIGVRLSGLVSGSFQINLFEDTEEDVRLLQAMDHIRNRFGEGAVSLGGANTKR
jgi:DNA polymerase-4